MMAELEEYVELEKGNNLVQYEVITNAIVGFSSDTL
jgi:hypothetical protein